MHIMSTNFAKTLVWKHDYMTSNCDVINSAHQIQMTPYTTEWTPPWKFSAYATACDVESIWIYWPIWHFNPIIKMHLLPTDNSLSADCEQSSKTAFALHQWPRLHCAWKKKEKLLLVFAGGCLDFLLTRISEVRCRKSLPIIVWALEGGRGDQDPPGFWNY